MEYVTFGGRCGASCRRAGELEWRTSPKRFRKLPGSFARATLAMGFYDRDPAIYARIFFPPLPFFFDKIAEEEWWGALTQYTRWMRRARTPWCSKGNLDAPWLGELLQDTVYVFHFLDVLFLFATEFFARLKCYTAFQNAELVRHTNSEAKLESKDSWGLGLKLLSLKFKLQHSRIITSLKF